MCSRRHARIFIWGHLFVPVYQVKCRLFLAGGLLCFHAYAALELRANWVMCMLILTGQAFSHSGELMAYSLGR